MRISVQIEFDKTLDIETPKSRITIGRDPKNDVIIPHHSISRQHCTVVVNKGVFTITDLGSSNGTFVNGTKITPDTPTQLLPTSLVTLGKLDCEFAEGSLTQDQLEKAESIKASINSNATMTIRLARLDLNRPSKTLELERESVKQKKAARNPITEEFAAKNRARESDPRVFWIKLFIFLGIITSGLFYLAIP